LRRQCQLLGVNRSVLYYKNRESDDDIWLINLIREIWLERPFYGYRKIKAVLKMKHDLSINNKRIVRLMRSVGIKALYPKPKLSNRNHEHKIFPYLLRNITVMQANHVWMVDITYLRLKTRFVYLVALIDVHSRYIVGWNLSFELDTENCLHALKLALRNGTAAIINSDQGVQFTSKEWVATLTKLYIRISMDGKGRYRDNIYIERFWRTIKYEAYYLNEYETFKELYLGIKEYIDFYNNERPHQALKYKTPKMIYDNRKDINDDLLKMSFGTNRLNDEMVGNLNNRLSMN